MKSKIRFKGKLRSYLCWPLLLTLPLILADIGLYFYDVATGIVVSGFIVIYFTVEISLYYYNKPHSMPRYRSGYSMSLRYRMPCWTIQARFFG